MRAKLIAIAAFTLVMHLSAADAQKNKPLRRAAAEAAGAKRIASFEQVLNDEQRKQVREFMQEQGADFRENVQKMAQLRGELQEMALSGKVDEKLIREKTEAIGKLEAEQLRVRTLALSKVAVSLTLDQREQIKEIRERIRAERPGLGADLREREILRKGDPAAPPPPEK